MQYLTKEKEELKRAQSEYHSLEEENRGLKAVTYGLQKQIEDIIALYEITKDICASLDEEKIFSAFKERAQKYLKGSECRFLKDATELAQYQSCTILPLEINKINAGFLAASGIQTEDKEKFHILAQQFLLGIKRALLYKKVQELSITDSLTAVFSRRHFLERFAEELERSKRLKYSLAFLMLDIDDFKKHNDTYGHLVGDVVLKEICKTIKENLRQVDLICRYGGEEFSVMLSETNKEQALVVAERIRQAIEEKKIKAYDEELHITISMGISIFPDNAEEAQALIDKADAALYEAKKAGKNKVCAYLGLQ